ncbi:MAG: SirB2 family protein [Lysobacter sp.]|nr:SirB2 family protein [Lysobacter sp.]
MIEFYPQIRLVHIVCVVLSGTLFFLRGAGVLTDARWPMVLPVRLASYSIDTVLLTAALMLLATLPGGVFANGWLATKLALLVVYVVLGSFALKRARTPRARRICFVAAMATYLSMASVARMHHPLGLLVLLPT